MMNRTIVALAIIGWCLTIESAARGQGADVQRLLGSAAAYLDQYEQDVRSVVLQETYAQSVASESRTRTLRSDLVVVADATEGWIELRDVFEVDGKPVRDHTDRIVQLLSKPWPNQLVQARRLANESARFNLNPVRAQFHRTINVPFTALRFLRRANQPRSAWRLEREERIGEQPAALLRFDEREQPRLIGSKDPMDVSGAFLIGANGAVLLTELRTTGRISAVVTVRYARHEATGLWLPERMDERYRIKLGTFLTDVNGHASYDNFRQFKVETSIKVK